jgi:hypothetical protein
MPSPQTFYRLNPHAAELYEKAVASHEMERVMADVERWKGKGGCDPRRVERAVGRFVVEPVAIKLAEGRGRWWEVFERGVREEVVRRVVRGVVE